jgi:hypothetical protein
VRNLKEAIAIGPRAAGASKYERGKNRTRERRDATEKDRRERYDDGAEAKRRTIPGRWKMSNRELERALQ